MESVTGRAVVQQVAAMPRMRHVRRRDHSVRTYKNRALAHLSPADLRYADNFVLWFEAQKLHKRFLGAVTSNDVNACFCQQPNGGCTLARQFLSWKLKTTLMSIAFGDVEMMSPSLPFGFARCRPY